jgi:hypothetical protein
MSKKNGIFKSVDTLSKELDIVDSFVLKYWKKYVIAAIIILVAITAFLVFSKKNSSNGITTSNEILAASTSQQLKDVIKKYPKYPLTEYAKLKLASMLAKAMDYSEAVKVYNELISFSNGSYAIYVTRLDMAYLIETQGKKDEAVKLFSQISDDTSLPIIIRGEAEYSAGRIYFELGNKDMASKYLKRCANVEIKECLGWPEMAQSLLNRIN